MCFLFLKLFYLGYFYFGEVAHSCFIGFSKMMILHFHITEMEGISDVQLY